MRIILLPSKAIDKATFLLTQLQRGQDVSTNDLEVFDALLKMLPDSMDVKIQSADKVRDREFAERIRFERGLDLRPIENENHIPTNTDSEVR